VKTRRLVQRAVSRARFEAGALQARALRRRRLAFYSEFVSHGDLVFDVGANTGNRTRTFLDLGAIVVAVEPQESCTRHLSDRLPVGSNLHVVNKGLAAEEGTAELALSGPSALASMSTDWIAAVKRSGRFANFDWDHRVPVPVTTIDRLIADYGEPVFCKIDVEGSEYQVLRGLSRPLRTLSFEFASELLENARLCVQRLTSLGDYRFNYCLGESMQFASPIWMSARAVTAEIEGLSGKRPWGDIYARHEQAG